MEERIEWPNGATMACMLSFDVDGEAFWHSVDPENANRPKILSLGTYGPHRGVPRILDLLDELQLKVTFFIPGHTAERYPDMVKDAYKRGHEIGFHGYLHENFSKLDEKKQREIFDKAKKILEDLTGNRVIGFRLPIGDWAKTTLNLVEEYGFEYSSSMRGDDRPYRTMIDGRATDIIELPTPGELNDFIYFGSNLMPPITGGSPRIASTDHAYQVYSEAFMGYYKYGLMYAAMFHPQVIGRPGRMLFLERLLRFAKTYPRVWFATGAEIAEYWKQKYL